MGCSNERNSKDALVLMSMLIIGSAVEVQVTDGSVYSGILHTACFHDHYHDDDDDDYGIVLKKAILSTTAKHDNASDQLDSAGLVVIDTLVISSCDLVQLLSKEGISPSHLLQGPRSPQTQQHLLTKTNRHLTQLHHSRNSGQNGLTNNEDGLAAIYEKGQSKGDFVPKSFGNVVEFEIEKLDISPSAKMDEVTTVPVGTLAEGEARKNQSQGKPCEPYQNLGVCKDNAVHEDWQSNPAGNASLPQIQLNSVDVYKTSNETSSGCSVPLLLKSYPKDFERPHSPGSSLDFQSPSINGANTISQVSTSQSASHTPILTPKDPVSDPSSKEFKLNPGAKTFMPMFSSPKAAASPTPTTAAGMDIISNSPIAVPVAVVPPENGMSPFTAHSSLTTKFVPTNNVFPINADNSSHYSQLNVGHIGGRLQSGRYTSQYNPVQTGPAYVHPTLQAVMVGRPGQLVYMHPISHDLIQGSTIPAPVSLRPQFSPQVLLPKHQGSVAAQALQVCVSQPPFSVGGQQQPYAMASSIPFSQPIFPAVRPSIPMTIPGNHGHTKFF